MLVKFFSSTDEFYGCKEMTQLPLVVIVANIPPPPTTFGASLAARTVYYSEHAFDRSYLSTGEAAYRQRDDTDLKHLKWR